MNISTKEVHARFNYQQTIIANRSNAVKIVNHFITRGLSFFVEHVEDNYRITFSENVDLNNMHYKLKSADWRVE